MQGGAREASTGWRSNELIGRKAESIPDHRAGANPGCRHGAVRRRGRDEKRSCFQQATRGGARCALVGASLCGAARSRGDLLSVVPSLRSGADAIAALVGSLQQRSLPAGRLAGAWRSWLRGARGRHRARRGREARSSGAPGPVPGVAAAAVWRLPVLHPVGGLLHDRLGSLRERSRHVGREGRVRARWL